MECLRRRLKLVKLECSEQQQECHQVGEEIIIQGLVSHGEEFGFYPVYSGRPSAF